MKKIRDVSILRYLAIISVVLCLFRAAQGQEIATQPPGAATNHPDTSGGRQYLPLERPTMVMPESEGILGPIFPNIHGNDALHLDYVYTGGIFNNSRGGLQTKNGSAYVGIANIAIMGDTEKLGLWKNGTFFVSSLFSHGPSPSRFVGDAQGVAVFAYETPAQVSEYWYEHRLFRDRLSVKMGKMDAGTDFFYLDSTADFINASYTCIPTTRIPTAPCNAWGVAANWKLTDQLCFKFGIFDGQGNANKFWMSEAGDYYATYQIEYHYSLFRRLPGFAFVGGWNDDCSYSMLYDETITKTGNAGISFGFEQTLCRRNICNEDDLRGLYLFANFGNAKDDRTEIDKYWSTGLLWRGIGRRNDDSIGTAVNYAYFSDHLGTTYAYESAWELFYKFQLTRNCSLQPDLQYVAHPSGEERDAVVTGLIFQMIF